jgi:carbon-monoxide dehydrogenase small subunit
MNSSNIKRSFRLNGREVGMDVPPQTMLADYLRDTLGLKGTKIGCSRGVCGSCTVLIDGVPRAACSTFAFQAAGADVVTIEGLQQDGRLDPVQRAFIDNSAFQCGYCTAGMIMLAKALLDTHPDPTREQIVEWMSSNICRCTGYLMIVEAVERAAEARREGA